MIRVLSVRGFASLQDRGRDPRWRRLGLPAGGVMDDQAASAANRLLGNPADAPVIELFGGIVFEATARIAIAGAAGFRTAEPGRLEIAPPAHGVWSYVAIAGGLRGPTLFGSASALPRAGIGALIRAGDALEAGSAAPSAPESIGERRYEEIPPIRVHRGPQWSEFSERDRGRLFAEAFRVAASSDRTGYRLEGVPLAAPARELISEPMRVGTLQVPPAGNPIVILRDGPTIGGYAKLGLVHREDLSWLVQAKPGTQLRFVEAAP